MSLGLQSFLGLEVAHDDVFECAIYVILILHRINRLPTRHRLFLTIGKLLVLLLNKSFIRNIDVRPFDYAHVVYIQLIDLDVRDHHKLILISQFELQIVHLVIKFDNLRLISFLQTFVLIFEPLDLKLSRFGLILDA